ncbi:hypothetical protein B0H15DRAFT_803158 [Mycena belliarum]|uniref:Uncharacterized protein n=1 Tax=Mycena belliarum TaxID=1033014 RepID=A0AAD6TXH5_9AGAR|nr:hypothetical protein B0H15DRAFT_803158 [Mycena belliae]
MLPLDKRLVLDCSTPSQEGPATASVYRTSWSDPARSSVGGYSITQRDDNRPRKGKDATLELGRERGLLDGTALMEYTAKSGRPAEVARHMSARGSGTGGGWSGADGLERALGAATELSLMHKGMVTERLRLLVGDNESELLGRDVNADAEPPGVHEGRLDCYRLRCCWEGRDADAGHDLDAEEGERRRAAGKEAQSRSAAAQVAKKEMRTLAEEATKRQRYCCRRGAANTATASRSRRKRRRLGPRDGAAHTECWSWAMIMHKPAELRDGGSTTHFGAGQICEPWYSFGLAWKRSSLSVDRPHLVVAWSRFQINHSELGILRPVSPVCRASRLSEREVRRLSASAQPPALGVLNVELLNLERRTASPGVTAKLWLCISR